MIVKVQRLMDDGYGTTHVIGESVFDETLYEDIQKADSDNEIYDALLEIVEDTDIDLYELGNPKGYGNLVDEFRIYVDGQLYKTV
jgi:hypothetical protein